jgi:glutamate-1-semialdehyde aminotransferase
VNVPTREEIAKTQGTFDASRDKILGLAQAATDNTSLLLTLIAQLLEELAALRAEVDRLASAIRDHRDQRGDDRCFEDDQKLYGVLGEPIPANVTALPPRCDFLESCSRYHEQRQNPADVYPPDKMTIAQLEAEVDRLNVEVQRLESIIASKEDQ